MNRLLTNVPSCPKYSDDVRSVAKTSEIGLSQRSGKNYESIIYLVEEATRLPE